MAGGSQPSLNTRYNFPDKYDSQALYYHEVSGACEPQAQQESSTTSSSLGGVSSDLLISDTSAFAGLRHVMPVSMSEPNSLYSSFLLPNTQIITSLHHQVLFSVANSFAGLDASNIGDVICFLQKETNEELYLLIGQAPGYSARAMAQNAFKGAIEAGDAEMVDFLLTQNLGGIDINNQFCRARGLKFTPIERASYLRHKSVVEILLKHHADVNRTYPDCRRPQGAQGALECACILEGAIDPRMDPDLFRMLVEAGADLGEPSMRLLIASGEGELVLLVMAANALRHVNEWTNMGTFRDALGILDGQTSIGVVSIMLEVKADLKYHVRSHRDGAEYSNNVDNIPTAIDAAAYRGSFSAVKSLLNSGALLTGDTLSCAVESGNEDLVHWVLDQGADIRGVASYGVTPLAAAIRLPDPRIINILLGSCDISEILSDQVQRSAAFRAAVDTGAYPGFERLIALEAKISPQDLGYSLAKAIRDGRCEFAEALIDAGAATYVEEDCEGEAQPLAEALKLKNVALVHSILDADGTSCFDPERGSSLLVLAAKWGDLSIVEAAIFSGARVNSRPRSVTNSHGPLSIAVQRQNTALVKLLLDAGANINAEAFDRSTPLEAALKNGDISMARFLLDQGAEPHDPRALESAIGSSKELFYLLVERHAMRYPLGRKGFGFDVLIEAVRVEDESVVKYLLERGEDANFKPHYETASPFGLAIASNHNNIAECMLRNGCDPNSIVSHVLRSDMGLPASRVTALLVAIGTGNVSTIETLLEYGADVNLAARGPIKRTPLQRAAEIGITETVQLLYNRGADVNATPARTGGGTALQLAAIGGYIPVAIQLLSLKADVNAPGSKANGRTALEGAAEHGRLDMVKVLLNAGAGAGSRESEQKKLTNAIALAEINEHFAVCDLLRDHLADRLRQDRQGGEVVVLTDENIDGLPPLDLYSQDNAFESSVNGDDNIPPEQDPNDQSDRNEMLLDKINNDLPDWDSYSQGEMMAMPLDEDLNWDLNSADFSF